MIAPREKWGPKMENSLFQEMKKRIALEEWTAEYNVVKEEKDLIRQQQKSMSIMREIRLEFDLSVMSSSDEAFSKEVIFLYAQLETLSKKIVVDLYKVI